MELTQRLKIHFGFDRFKGNQEEIIKNLLEGNDTFVLMPTGGGKSLCYQLPSLILEGTSIIISPLIALMKNQVDAMRGFSEEDGIAHFLNSSLSKTEIQKVKQDILSGKTKMLYVAPESLTKEEYIQFFRQIKISFYAIDEAHCISEWGHDFRPEYRRIKPIVEQIAEAPIIALTATATPKVQHDIQKNLNMLDAKVFKSSFNRTNLYYEVRPKAEAAKEIIKFIKENPGKSGIVYCLSRKKVEELAEVLQINGINALPYHAGMDSATRSATQDKFLMEEINVIVATIAFGMGIDKPDVRFVIHYDVPKSLEGYYQETGRAGRDGGEGKCISFYTYKDIQKLEKFMQGKPVAEQEIGRHLLLETISYSESALCRRKYLLHYFGEDYKQDNCGSCDNCLYPKKQFEGKNEVVKMLKVVVAVNEYFKSDHIAHILAGEVNSSVKSYKHDQIKEFASGKDKDIKFWNGVVRQALIAKLVVKDIENYGLIKMTEKGQQFLKKPTSFLLVEDHDYDQVDKSEENLATALTASDPILFAMLKDLTKKIAKERKLPHFVIFQEPSLQDMSIHYPITLDEMQNMTGVGMGKANKYGERFCELIKQYVEENEIDRPIDMVVKSVVNKSGIKVNIIQNIDRKIPLDAIAQSNGMDMDELIKELEAIVYSGTKINIDYFINEILDDEHQEEIYDYFMQEAKTESIKDALAELGEDEYSEQEIRMMRVKFLSNEGN